MKRFAATVVACWMAVAVAGGARQDQTQPLPRFRSGVELIRIDATVLDGADHLLELPLADGAPGPHLLTFEVRLVNGVPARRDVRLSVR